MARLFSSLLLSERCLAMVAHVNTVAFSGIDVLPIDLHVDVPAVDQRKG
jgi:hypothetical protein